jgi:peptide/nickel transport system substrate-binding protein
LTARRCSAPLALVLAAALAACGNGGEGTPAVQGPGAPGVGGKLVWALEERPEVLDPLLADERGEQLVSRQVHEPLVASLAGPFGDARRLPGLAYSATPSADHTIWRLRLRRGVRFQDGSLLDAAAVLANAERWGTTSEGRALLPALLAADAPRPDLVRFILNRPDRELDERLASPRLGLVSPRALASGRELRPRGGTGTGPFELRELEAERLLLAPNTGWWGATRDLGPALALVEFRVEPSASERLELLARGEVQVAEALGPEHLERLRREPLLVGLRAAGGEVLGLERSVRGIESGTQVPSLSAAWLTRVAGS